MAKTCRVVVDGEPQIGKSELVSQAMRGWELLSSSENSFTFQIPLHPQGPEFFQVHWQEINRSLWSVEQQGQLFQEAEIICVCCLPEINARLRAFRRVSFLREKYPGKTVVLVQTRTEATPILACSIPIYASSHLEACQKFVQEPGNFYAVGSRPGVALSGWQFWQQVLTRHLQRQGKTSSAL